MYVDWNGINFSEASNQVGYAKNITPIIFVNPCPLSGKFLNILEVIGQTSKESNCIAPYQSIIAFISGSLKFICLVYHM